MSVPPRPDLPADPAGRQGSTRTDAWHRLHPLSPVVRASRALLALVIVFAPTLLSGRERDAGSRSTIDLAVAGLLVALGVVSWLVTRWRIQEGALRIETGLIKRSSLRFPLVQIQAIDVVRPFLARAFGLAELRLRMGGSTGRSGRLAYLTARDADVLRARLLALAHGIPEDTPAPAERVLVSVPVGRLIGSIMLSRLGLTVEAVVATLVTTALLSPAAAAAVIASSAAVIVGLLTAVWHRFNGEYDMTVADAPDGLRLRSGLLETTAETIPRGRVQAMRMIEPLLWRPFGWCRMQVDVAGRQRTEGENRSQSHALRAVLPVGTRQEARLLLDRIMPEAPGDRLAAPTRVRIKSPWRYHYLAWSRTERCAVTTSGRVSRITDWIPLAKVQSLRWVQGPLQRRLRLATIHLDTAGRSVHAAIRDRDSAEADQVLTELIELCRTARRATTA